MVYISSLFQKHFSVEILLPSTYPIKLMSYWSKKSQNEIT